MSASDLLNPLSSIGSLCYSPDPKGLLSARESVTDYYARHGATVAPEHLVLTASTSEAYSYLFRLLCEPKEEILIAQPSYPLFDYLADLSDISLRHYPLFYDHGWWIDTAELEGAITPRTRAIVLVHPNNPTGHLTSSGERDFLFDLCRRYDLTLIVDEVFLDYPHERLADVQSFAQSDSPPLTFVLSGLSKILALPQAKISWILALGPEKEKAEALARLDIIADTFLSVSTLSQLACPIWLQKAPEVQTGVLERIALNRSLLASAGVEEYKVDAGWSSIVRLPQVFTQRTAFTTLRREGVITHPLAFYGLNDPNRVVLSLITPTEIMSDAIARIIPLLHGSRKVENS